MEGAEAMINFLIQKIWKNKWMMFCLLVGNVLLIAIAAAAPMYSSATTTRMIRHAMRDIQADQGRYPAVSQLSYDFNDVPATARIPTYESARDAWLPEMKDALAVPIPQTVRTYTMTGIQAFPQVRREYPNARRRNMNFFSFTDSEEHIRLIYGRMPSDNVVTEVIAGPSGDMEVSVIELLALEITLYRQNILHGELFRVDNIYDQEAGEPYLYFRVVGIYEIPEESRSFWAIIDFFHPSMDLLLAEGFVQNRILPDYHPDYRLSVMWTNIHDFESMAARRTAQYISGIHSQQELFAARRGLAFNVNYYDVLVAHREKMAAFNITLLVLQMPLYFLLAFYIFVVSRKILQMEQNDVSVLKSRGASRGQIFGIYVMQGIFIGTIAFPAGVMLGTAICRILGASAGFLYLASRTHLQVEITALSLAFGGVAVLFSFLTMILPVIRFSRTAIIEHKLNKSGRSRKPLWERYFLDVICLGVAIYVIYTFNIQQELAPAGGWIDPMHFIASTLFMTGLGLFCLRLFPYLMRLIFTICRSFLPVSLYASMLRISRSAGEEQFIMIFLVFTMALGIYSAQAARTINLNTEHEIRYLGGADLRFQEHWWDNMEPLVTGWTNDIVYSEPSFERFTGFEEVDSLTRVMSDSVTARGGVLGEVEDVTFMAIEPFTFGEAIWFRDDLLQTHVNHYLNALSQVPDGVLLSVNFMEMGFAVGDRINLEHTRTIPRLTPLIIRNTSSFMIAGFVDYWPTYRPQVRVEIPGSDGRMIYAEQHLAVVNLGHIRNQWGVWPYEIWMRTNTDNNRFFRDFQQENTIWLTYFRDTSAAVAQARLGPLIQGTNGVLTVNFIVTLLICFTGFLIYWILSIRDRMLQFGVFRALGMSMRSVIRLLINEQLFTTLTALLIGALVGEISARLFVPIIQLAFTDQVIPLLVVMEAGDYVNLYMIMGAMIVMCLGVLITYITRMRIDQALKLGED